MALKFSFAEKMARGLDALEAKNKYIKHPDSPYPTIPIDILDDLSSRFIINIPNDERSDVIRVMFQIELAHWFYLDFNCVERKGLPKFHFRNFCQTMFNHVPFLKLHLTNFDEIIDKWKEYKASVPTYGAILLDESMENVLMVQGFWTKASWGFPKGKVNAEEDPVACACREVKEETGYDCSNKVNAKDYIEVKLRDTSVRLYIIPGVSMKETFQPITRGEIKHIEWFQIKDIPAHKTSSSINANTFFMAIPFISKLKRWITNRKNQEKRTKEENLKSEPKDFIQEIPQLRYHKEKVTIKNNKRRSFAKTPDYSSEKFNKRHELNEQGLRNNSRSVEPQMQLQESPEEILRIIPIDPSLTTTELKFWCRSWENVQLDWEKIWKEVLSEL